MTTTWKICPIAPKVEASADGLVRSVRGKTILKARNRKGYLRIRLRPKDQYIHRLVASAFLGECPAGYEVNHINGNPSDNRVANLEYVTRKENIRHSLEVLGRRSVVVGERNHRARFNEKQVRVIKRLLADGLTAGMIAAIFRVPNYAIANIKLGRCWAHVQV